jgi:hypothetical protein
MNQSTYRTKVEEVVNLILINQLLPTRTQSHYFSITTNLGVTNRKDSSKIKKKKKRFLIDLHLDKRERLSPPTPNLNTK